MKIQWITSTILCSLLINSTQVVIANENINQLGDQRIKRIEGSPFPTTGSGDIPRLETQPLKPQAQPQRSVRVCKA